MDDENRTEELLKKGRYLSLFPDIEEIAVFDKVSYEGQSSTPQHRIVTGRGLWTAMKKQEYSRCMALNAKRLESWGMNDEANHFSTLVKQKNDTD